MTKGSPTRLLLLFLLPLLLGNIFQQFYSFADSAIVGRYVGAGALAAVGASGPLNFLFFSFCGGLSNGGGIVASQAFGARDREKVQYTISNAAYLVLIVSMIMGLIGFLSARTILGFLQTPDDIMRDAVTYMRVASLGVPAVGIYNYISSMLRALGDSRTPLFFLIGASALNIALDLIFIRSFGMGVFGAALATVISQALSGILCIIWAFFTNPYFRLDRKHLAFHAGTMKNIVRLGSTLGFQYSLIAVSTMALQSVVNSFGSVAVAAFTITSRIEQVVHQPFSSLGTAMSTYSGQNYGANQKDRILLGFRKGLVIMAVYSVALVPVMYLFGNAVSSIFTKDADVLHYAGNALRLTSLFYLALGVIYVIRGILNGVGDAIFAFINGIVEVAGRITIPLLITSPALLGVWGIWVSAGLVWVLSAAACVLRYFGWKRRNYPSSSEEAAV